MPWQDAGEAPRDIGSELNMGEFALAIKALLEPIITKEHLDAMPMATAKVDGKRRLVDIAVPRNVCASCSKHAETICYNVDDLGARRGQ